VPLRSIIARCFVRGNIHASTEQQQKIVQEGNRSRMTIDHKSASGVSDTPALPQRLRQG